MKVVRIVGLCFLGCFALLAAFGDTGSPPVIPEPSTIIMLATGLAGVGFAAWRRNRKR
jgi:PEP-CTERM motif-containing protein